MGQAKKENDMMQKVKKFIAVLMVLTLIVLTGQVRDTQAAAKGVKLSSSQVKLKVGKSKKVTVINTTGSKVKSVAWTITKNKKVVSLTKKTTSYVKVKAKKKGTAKVTAKITLASGKVYKKTLTVKVTANSSKNQEDTSIPVKDKTPKELAHYDMTTNGKTLLDVSGNGYNAKLVDVDTKLQENNSLYMEKGGYIELPKDIFTGEDTLTISIWTKDYNGKVNTSAMFVGTKENMPVSYWLLNPSNPSGRMKSVLTNSVNEAEPYRTEMGISPSTDSMGIKGPFIGTEWNHFVTVITPDKLTAYKNGEKVGSVALTNKFRGFANNIVAYIGKSSYPDVTYKGYIREVQVFRGEKSDAEVTQIYDSTKGNEVKEKTKKSNIFIADRADPYITKGEDGYYYFTASYPMYGGNDKEGYDRVILRRSKTLKGLQTAEEKTIWHVDESKTSFRFIWAPEMHYIGGKWYMYYAASDKSTDVWHIDCHVLMCEGNDPYNDTWVEKGKFQKVSGDNSFGGFSLDMTYFENAGKSYVIWAEKKNNGVSRLYMGEVNKEEPWKLTTKSMMLSEPEYAWECVTFEVNEGPSVIHHDGKVIVAYSASATGPEYCIGYLYADEGADLMKASSWTKQKTPALTSEDLTDEYGPGHNSFTVDEEGNPIFVYHSRAKECFEGKCGYGDGDPLYDPCRSAHLRKVTWDSNGLPVLNGEPYEVDAIEQDKDEFVPEKVNVTSENDLAGYLYVCFANTAAGKDVQQIHFFLSQDGLNWTAVNGCMPAYMAGKDYPTDNYTFAKNWKLSKISDKKTYNATPGATDNGAFYKASDIAGTIKGDASVLFPFEGRDHGLRDPYLIRGSLKDGSDAGKIRILATDLNVFDKQYGNVNWGRMTSSKEAGDEFDKSGSGGSKQLFIFETEDMVHWERRTVDVATEIGGGCAWAPEAIYNPEKDNYLVYWSCRVEADGYARNRLYCNETRDFVTFGPTKLYEQEDFYKDWGKFVNMNDGYGNIDTSQLWVADGDNPYGTLYRLVKDETDNHIQLMSAKSVLDPEVDYDASQPNKITPFAFTEKKYETVKDIRGLNDFRKAEIVWNWFKNNSVGDHFTKISQKHMEHYSGAYEGATMFKFIGRDEWCVMIDYYGDNSVRYEPYLTSDLSKPMSIKKAKEGTYGRTAGDVGCHGGVIPITMKEYNQMIDTYNNENRYAEVTGIALDEIRTKKNSAGYVYHDIEKIEIN